MTDVSPSESDVINRLAEAGLNGTVEEEWETVSDDNGELVRWSMVGTEYRGFFIDRRTVALPEDQQKTRPDGSVQTEADMLVFEDKDGERWSTWITYQLDRIIFVQGDEYIIKYKAERKSREGNTKIFDVKRRKVSNRLPI